MGGILAHHPSFSELSKLLVFSGNIDRGWSADLLILITSVLPKNLP